MLAMSGSVCLVAPAAAQESDPLDRPAESGWIVGASVGLPGFAGQTAPELFTLAVHATEVRAGGIGPDLWLGTMPRGLLEGVVVGGARLGLALPMAPSPDLVFLPAAGISLLGALGSGVAGGLAGVHAGLSIATLSTSMVSVRLGVTRHWVGQLEGGLWLIELGVGRGPPEVR